MISQIDTGQESEGQKGDFRALSIARDHCFQILSLKPKHIDEEAPSPNPSQGQVTAGIDIFSNWSAQYTVAVQINLSVWVWSEEAPSPSLQESLSTE